MNVIFFFLALIASILGTYTPMPAMAPSACPSMLPERSRGRSRAGLTETNIQQQRLDAVAHEFASLSNLVEQPHLNIVEKKTYLRFLHTCASKQKYLAEKIADNTDCSHERQLGLMEQFVEYIKKAYLKLHLVTVGRDTNDYAFLEKPLEQRLYHQTLTTIQLKMYAWLESVWKSNNSAAPAGPASNDELSNDEITLIVRLALPLDLFSDLYIDNLLEALTFDLYDDYSILADEYIACIEQCQNSKNSKYTDDIKTYVALVSRLVDLIDSLEETNDEHLNFFITNLFSAKLDIAYSQQLRDVKKRHPDLIDAFKQHHRLMHDDEFITVYNTLSPADRKHLDEYKTLMDHFFTTNPFQSLRFVSDVEALIVNGKKILKKITPHENWKTTILEYFKEKGLDGIDFFITKFGLEKLTRTQTKTISNDSQHPLAEMRDILISIHTHITQNREEAESSWSELSDYVRSGKWFTDNVVQNDEGNIALEFANKALDSTKFTDAKSAAKQACIYATPFLLVKIVEYLRARFGKKIEPEIDALIPQKVDGTTGNNSQILDFAKNNPEVLVQLTQAHPEILDLLAESLKDLARKPG